VRIPVETLLNGVARALIEQVLPHVSSRSARGQLYAAVDVLRNAARRLEWAAAPLVVEAESAEAALRSAAARLREAGEAARAGRIEARLEEWPAGPVAARAEAAREALAHAFAELESVPPALGDAIRPILGGHLAAQAVRALALLQPSLLEEISRG